MTQPNDKLRSTLEHTHERHSLLGPKPQDLAYGEIVDRVAEFLLSQEIYRIALSFGAGVLSTDVDDGERPFDPIWLYQTYPDQFETIAMYVDAELRDATEALLAESSSNISAYNTLLFGIAILLSRSEPLPARLRAFLIDHLLEPKPPIVSKGKGRPKKFPDDKLFKKRAIQFAKEHGLKPTRNDEGSAKTSACDAVSDAAQKIYQDRKDAQFATGYSFENLKKIWQQVEE